MSLCVVCGAPLDTDRTNAQTCSGRCRSKLHRERQKIKQEIERTQLSLFQFQDLEQLGKIDQDAKNAMNRLFALYGKEAYELAMDAIFGVLEKADLMTNGRMTNGIFDERG